MSSAPPGPASESAARFGRLNAALDELLDLDPAAQAERLAAWRQQDPAWADELAGCLARDRDLEAAGFLATPALAGPAEPPAAAGQVLGAYTLERVLGEGGMGQVWLARRSDGRFDGHVAIKLLRLGGLSAPEQARFQREGRILARLAHPHIARLQDAGVTPQGQPYLVLEWVDGQPIDAWCRAHAPGVAEVLRLFLQVLDAVAHAHGRLILHRDLKPSNVLVNQAGEVKLLDFGIARLLQEEGAADGDITQQAGRAFTATYAAPEQIEGGDMGTATDVHALGVLLFLLLSGRHPWLGDPEQARRATTFTALRAVLEQAPARLSSAATQGPWPQRQRALRGDLDLILAKALARRPADRYAHAGELAAELLRHLDQRPIRARPPQRWHVAWRFVQRHRWPVAAASAALLALVAGLGVALNERREALRQQARAEDLVEFLLSDLPKRLRPVGRLDVLDAVGEKALAHYASQPADGLDDAALGRRARALHLIGEIASQRGQTERAVQVFDQAAQATGELLDRQPDDPQRLFDHAQSQFWKGEQARRLGRPAQAEPAFQQYLALSQQLVQQAPARADWAAEPAYAWMALGVLQVHARQPEQAERHLAQAQAAMAPWVPGQPGLVLALSDTWGWRALARELQGDLPGALAALREKEAALDLAGPAPDDRTLQSQRAVGGHEQARLNLALGQTQAAHALLAASQARMQALQALDPDNRSWRAEDLLGQLLAVELALVQGQAEAARAALARTQVQIDQLVVADPDRPAWRLRLRAKARWLAGQVALRSGAGTEAAREALQAQLDGVPPTGATLEPDHLFWAAADGLVLGDLLQRQGQGEAAHQAWAAAQARLAVLPASRDPAELSLRIQLQQRLAPAQAEPGLAETLRSTAFRHPLWWPKGV